MSELITYVRGYPVRKEGVTYQQILREFAKNEQRIKELEHELTAARLELEEYQAIGSKMLFRLLKNKFRNGDM